jgi:multicomponent K+:H+ antiporter subunit G
MGALLLASMLHFSQGDQLSLHELLVTGFLFLTAPVSAHMLAKAALHLGVTTVTRAPRPEDQDAFPETAPGYTAPSATDDPNSER